MKFDNYIKDCYDFIQESVEFSKRCGEYDDTKADVDGFINSKLNNDDKSIINKLIENSLNDESEIEDVIQMAVSKFVFDKYNLKTY